MANDQPPSCLAERGPGERRKRSILAISRNFPLRRSARQREFTVAAPPLPEAFQQARLIYDSVARITGGTPQTILLPEPASPASVSTFTPANPPLNPRLMDLYSLVHDRLGLIRTCYDARRLLNGRPDCDMPYWGDDPLRNGWRMVPESCVGETEWCDRSSPYRFVFQIQKAHEIVGRTRASRARRSPRRMRKRASKPLIND
jgi:hypothetical protein